MPVHLLQLPVPLAARTQQHHEELMREFALIGADDDPEAHVPRRLLDLVHVLTQQFARAVDAPRERLQAAIRRGDPVIPDHVLELPAAAGPAAQALAALMDEDFRPPLAG